MDLISTLAPLLIPILVPLIIAMAAALYQFLMQRSPANVHQLTNSLASTVISGIEQYYDGEGGDHKKQLAIEAVQAILAALHVSVPAPLIDLSIESAVAALGAPRPVTSVPPPAPSSSQLASG